MAFKIEQVYTENPYVDTIVYNTKVLGLGTVLKMQSIADQNETLESKKNADLYIACMDNTAVFELFDEFSKDVLMKAGLTGTAMLAALVNPSKVPLEFRDAVLEAKKAEVIANYEELNNYYRMLYGLPPVGYTDVYVTDWEPPEGIYIDLSIPVHEMTPDAITILDINGVLDSMYEADPENRAYLKYLKRKISPYTARKAFQFEALYIPSSDYTEMDNEYKDRLEVNRQYALRAIYSEAYKYDSDYYDNFIAVFIVLSTMIDIISRVQEFIARKEIFDIRTVKYIFESYGVPFFDEIPMKYQIRMVKNLHTLLKYKSCAKCMVDICSLFGFENIKVFKYYLLHSRKYNKAEDEYSLTGDAEEDFDMKFVKIPIDGNMEDYIRDSTYHVGYDEITSGDETWDGGLDHDYVKEQHLNNDYNYTRTKYLSVDSIYDIAKITIQQCYFFNMLYDNVPLEQQININIPYISPEKGFNIANIFIFLTCLTYQYNGIKDMIMDTQSKILTVMGFNFKADLGVVASDLANMLDKYWDARYYSLRDTPSKTELQLRDEIVATFEKFNIPTDSIPSMKQLMNLFTNNLEVRDLLVAGMKNASNLRTYNVYKYLYDSLMTMELTLDFFKDPETGDFYRDVEGDATYTEYLRHVDPILYYKLVEIQLMDDDSTKTQYIANLIDNIIYVLEEFIDTDEFYGIFYGLPVVSADAVKQYIKTVIDFYKSYKVYFLGINTLYYLDDKYENWVKIIDWASLHLFFEKDDVVPIVDRIANMSTSMTKKERYQIIEKIYMDISTWKYMSPADKCAVRDRLGKYISKLNAKDSLILDDAYKYVARINGIEFSKPIDFETNRQIIINDIDKVSMKDVVTMNVYYYSNSRSSLSRSKYFSINNLALQPGTTIITDERINSNSTGVFTPLLEINDVYDENDVSVLFYDGSVAIINNTDEEILGTIQISI